MIDRREFLGNLSAAALGVQLGQIVTHEAEKYPDVAGEKTTDPPWQDWKDWARENQLLVDVDPKPYDFNLTPDDLWKSYPWLMVAAQVTPDTVLDATEDIRRSVEYYTQDYRDLRQRKVDALRRWHASDRTIPVGDGQLILPHQPVVTTPSMAFREDHVWMWVHVLRVPQYVEFSIHASDVLRAEYNHFARRWFVVGSDGLLYPWLEAKGRSVLDPL